MRTWLAAVLDIMGGTPTYGALLDKLPHDNHKMLERLRGPQYTKAKERQARRDQEWKLLCDNLGKKEAPAVKLHIQREVVTHAVHQIKDKLHDARTNPELWSALGQEEPKEAKMERNSIEKWLQPAREALRSMDLANLAATLV